MWKHIDKPIRTWYNITIKGAVNMSRAELRRKQREQKKDNRTYTFTARELEQLEQRIRQEEQKKAKQMVLDKTKALANEILTMMLVIPTNVLIADYWQKSAKKRIPKFVDDCLNLYEAFTGGVVKMSEMIDLTEEYAGIKLIQEDGQGHCSVFAEKVGE